MAKLRVTESCFTEFQHNVIQFLTELLSIDNTWPIINEKTTCCVLWCRPPAFLFPYPRSHAACNPEVHQCELLNETRFVHSVRHWSQDGAHCTGDRQGQMHRGENWLRPDSSIQIATGPNRSHCNEWVIRVDARRRNVTRSFGRGNRLINCDPYFIQKVEIISPVLSNSALPRSQIQDRPQAGAMADFHTSTLPDFDPPGNLPDLNAETRQVWSNKFISYWMTGEIEANIDVTIQKRTLL